MQNASERQPLAWQRASPFFCQKILERGVVQHGVRQQLLQPAVLALQPLQPLGLGDLEPAILGFPVVKACLADPVLATQVRRLHSGLVLFQDRDDLLFRIPLALHSGLPLQGQTPISHGSIQGGNVTRRSALGVESTASLARVPPASLRLAATTLQFRHRLKKSAYRRQPSLSLQEGTEAAYRAPVWP